jgi:predicted Zn-dependent peptidase
MTLIWQGADPELAHVRWRMPSGLDVIVHSDHTVPRVVVNVWYRVGSSDEGAGSSGFAHLYEHLFKEGLHLRGQRHYEVLRKAGATGANASTSSDRTAYHETMPSPALDVALWIESDRMGYFLPALTDERLAAQQAVVRQERRQRYENVPYGAERFAIASALWPEDHPHRHLTIGRHEDIEAATRARVADFYRTWYVPANATLVLAGDVREDEARLAIDRWFGGFPASERPVRPMPFAPPIAATRIALDDRFAALGRIHRVWHGPAAWTDGAFELDLLSQILAQPGTGRLWRRLVFEQRGAQRVQAWLEATRIGGSFHVAVDVQSGADTAAIRAILDEEFAAAIASIDEGAAARARRRREAGALWRLDGLESRASQLQRSMLYLERPDGLAAELARVRACSAPSIAAAAARWLDPARMIEVETRPRPTAAAPP